MKAEELRIGNVVRYAQRMPYGSKEYPTTMTGVVIGIDTQNDTSNVTLSTVAGVFVYEISCLHPIPLTEDLLLKCGFVKTDAGFQTYKWHPAWHNVDYGMFSILTCYDGKLGSGLIFHGRDIPCKYLHQLQNLFFELTGSELTVQL